MKMHAVIPTCDRPDELLNLVTELTDQGVEEILVINNGRGLPLGIRNTCQVYYDCNRQPHIYAMWNFGLGFWAPSSDHCVAILNDDIELPDNFAVKMSEALQDTDATIAFPNQGPGIVNTYPGQSVCTNAKRITGYAFVVNGAHGIQCDENFKWWYGDDDLDWTARQSFNGTFEVPGVTVKHLYPGKSTTSSPALQGQASADREYFIKKWGKAPW